MAAVNIGPNEIWLGGYYFPIKGPVRTANITATPNPVVFGDTSKQTGTQVMSQLDISSYIGGGGKYRGNVNTDIERFYVSQCETRWANVLTLPPRLQSSISTTTAPTLGIDFQNNVYWLVSASNKVTKQTGTLAGTSDVYAPAATTFFSRCMCINSGGKLQVIYRTAAPQIEVATSPDGTTWTASGGPVANVSDIQAMVTFRDLVYAAMIVTAGDPMLTIRSAGAGSVPGNPAGTVPYNVCRDMIVYDNSLYLATDRDLWVYDIVNTRWLPTGIQWPRHADSGRMCVHTDGKLYITLGGPRLVNASIGDPMTVANVGINREDGVPAGDPDQIKAICSDAEWLMIATQATSGSSVAIRASRAGGGWHTVNQNSLGSSALNAMVASQAYSVNRLYLNVGTQISAVDLDNGIYSPLQRTTLEFDSTGVHVTPWFDFGTEGQDKVHGHVTVRTRGCSANETVSLYYYTDLDDSSATALGTISANGVTTFKPGATSGKGFGFRHVRYAFVLARGGTATSRPIVEYFVPEGMRMLPATYGYAVQIDLSKSFKGQTPNQMLANLKLLADPAQTTTLSEFAYQDDLSGTVQTYWAKITRMTGVEYAGRELRGQGEYLISVTVPYQGDGQ
jgi:hypothetical protein